MMYTVHTIVHVCMKTKLIEASLIPFLTLILQLIQNLSAPFPQEAEHHQTEPKKTHVQKYRNFLYTKCNDVYSPHFALFKRHY